MKKAWDDIKSFVTVATTIVICYLAIIGKVDIKEIYLMIIGFYFGTQFQKSVAKKDGE